MHTSEAINKRATIQTNKFINKIQDENNLTVLERNIVSGVVEFIWKCNKCDNIYTQYHQSYFSCQACDPSFRSSSENEIVEELLKIDPSIKIQRNNRSILRDNRELDIVLPDHNIAIEFDGLYWHSELQGKDRKYHLNKTLECENNGYKLLHIFEDEWVVHKDIIIGKLSALVGKDIRTRVYGRQCTLKPVDYSITKKFLDKYHLQGADSANIRLGLYYNDELISVMTFSKPNASRGNAKNSFTGTYELSRYCTHSSFVCIGGASKLLKNFIKLHSPNRIISYADRRYSIDGGNVYNALGFSLISETSPSYWYMKMSNRLNRYHRFNFTKKKTVQLGGDPLKTEWENMINMGYDRIWDCGHLKYEMIL
jgi:hypothetical protein